MSDYYGGASETSSGIESGIGDSEFGSEFESRAADYGVAARDGDDGDEDDDDAVDKEEERAPAAVAPRTGRPPSSSSSGAQPTSAGRRRRKEFAVSTRWEREVAENGPIQDYHRYFCCCARRIGTMFILCERSDGSPLVIAGPCWPFCMTITLPLILGISALVCYFILFNPASGLPQWVAFLYLPALAFVLLALFMVSCRDPGLMERVTDEEAGQGGWYWNEQVGSFRPPGSLYCRECGVLIEGYDHLCPWTGTGIGHGNMLAFKMFVVGVNVLCYFSIALVAFVLLDGL